MGACISVHRKASAITVQHSFDSTIKLPDDHKPPVIHSSNLKLLPVMDGHVAVKPQLPSYASPPTFYDHGRKEEMFFDSQAWLDSDYEDEFMSVNGEFTPSRSNTPVHNTLIPSRGSTPVRHSLIPSRGNKAMDHVEPLGFTDQPSSTPTKMSKRLSEFFKESPRYNHGSTNEESAELPHKYGDEMNSKKDGLHTKRERHVGSMQGCFTGLLSIHSTGRRNKKNQVLGLKLACS